MQKDYMQLAGNTWVPSGDDYFANYFKGCDVFEQNKQLNYDARNYLHSLDYEEVARIGRDVIFGY